MPNVTATPKGQLNGEVVTEFTDVTSTSSVTYTYPIPQSELVIENSGVSDILVSVGNLTNQVVQPNKKWRADVGFTSFSVRSDANSQEFIATSFQYEDANKTVTVGTIGDFRTINAALEYLSRKELKYSASGSIAEIKLLSGFVMAEQVIVEGIDLGWIRITSEDAAVSINRASLTRSLTIPAFAGSLAVTSFPAFGGINNAVLPIIAVLFDMDTTGTAGNKAGFFAGNGAQITIEPGKGCTNAGGQGLYCVQGARILAFGVNVSGAGANAISCFRGSTVIARDGNLSSAGANGVYADNNSFVEASYANISNAITIGVWASGSSTIACSFATISNSGSHGIQADNCSTIDAHSATINGSVLRGAYCLGGTISVKSANILNSGTDGIQCTNNGRVDADSAIITGSIGKGVYALYGGAVNAHLANAQKGGTTSTDDMRVVGGGTIYATGATGGLSQTANTLTASGIIYQ